MTTIDQLKEELAKARSAVGFYLAAGPSVCWGPGYREACAKEARLSRQVAEAEARS